MFETLEALEQQKAKTVRELEVINHKIVEAKKLNNLIGPVRAFSIQLHNQQCKWNHTDGCSYGYEKIRDENTWKNKNTEHYKWEQKANKLLETITLEEAYKLLPYL